MAPIETMAYSLSTVATDILDPGVPWVNQRGISGLDVPVEDPISLADACNQILSSPELRSRPSEGARQRFVAKFTKEVSAKRMMHAYDHILTV
jgi:glycosyltransferase involved in cell wall biosynthesis